MHRSVTVAAAAIVLATAGLSACGAPSAGHARRAASVVTPQQRLASAVDGLKKHDLGAYRLEVLHADGVVVTASVQYSRKRGFVSAIVQDTGAVDSSFTQLRLNGSDYFSTVADCYARLDYLGSSDVQAQFHLLVSTPEQFVAKARAVNYDSVEHVVEVRIPASEAVLLIGGEFEGARGKVLLSLLHGEVSAQVRLGADGEFETMYVNGDDVVPVLQALPSVPDAVIEAAADDNGVIRIQTDPTEVDLPPSDELKDSSQGCDTHET